MHEKTDELLERIKSHPPLSKWERESVYEELLPEFIYHSEALEGNSYTLEETEEAIWMGKSAIGEPMRNHLGIIGQREAYQFMTKLAEEKEPITGWAIQEMHRKMMVTQEDAGKLRTTPTRIRNSDIELKAELLPEQLERILEVYEELLRSKHPLDSIAMLILRFIKLAPFERGNGKIARLMMNLELIKEGYPPIVIRVEDKQKYEEALRYHQETATVEKMAELIDSYLQEKLEWLDERLSK